jgi:hypothetical protein
VRQHLAIRDRDEDELEPPVDGNNLIAQRRAEVATVLEALGKRSGLVGDDQLVLEDKAARAGSGAVEPQQELPQGSPEHVRRRRQHLQGYRSL